MVSSDSMTDATLLAVAALDDDAEGAGASAVPLPPSSFAQYATVVTSAQTSSNVPPLDVLQQLQLELGQLASNVGEQRELLQLQYNQLDALQEFDPYLLPWAPRAVSSKARQQPQPQPQPHQQQQQQHQQQHQQQQQQQQHQELVQQEAETTSKAAALQRPAMIRGLTSESERSEHEDVPEAEVSQTIQKRPKGRPPKRKNEADTEAGDAVSVDGILSPGDKRKKISFSDDPSTPKINTNIGTPSPASNASTLKIRIPQDSMAANTTASLGVITVSTPGPPAAPVPQLGSLSTPRPMGNDPKKASNDNWRNISQTHVSGALKQGSPPSSSAALYGQGTATLSQTTSNMSPPLPSVAPPKKQDDKTKKRRHSSKSVASKSVLSAPATSTFSQDGAASGVPTQSTAASKSLDLLEDDSRGAKGATSTFDQFLKYIEPYFRPLTEQDLTLLEVAAEVDEYIYTIPPLGPHYSLEWAKQDRLAYPLLASEDPDDLSAAARAYNAPTTEGDTIANLSGTLMTRIVSALLEEGFIPHSLTSPIGINAIQSTGSDGPEDSAETIPGALEMYHRGPLRIDPASMENRIKRELIFVGLLDDDKDDAMDASPNEPDMTSANAPAILLPSAERQDDEVSFQLRHLQSQLRAQVALNHARRARLYPRAYEYMAFQEYDALVNNLAKQVEAIYHRRFVNKTGKKGRKRDKPRSMLDSERKIVQDYDTIEKLNSVLPPDVYTPPTESIFAGWESTPNPNPAILLNNVVYPSKSLLSHIPDAGSAVGQSSSFGVSSGFGMSSSVGASGLGSSGGYTSGASATAGGSKPRKKIKGKNKGYDDEYD